MPAVLTSHEVSKEMVVSISLIVGSVVFIFLILNSDTVNDLSAGNSWNTTYNCSIPEYSNIIGGNCIGGNYWSDYYTGLDNTSSHASCVIINISKRKGFYYNPGIGPIEEEKNVCKKLEKLIAYSYYGTPSESNKIRISPLFIPESPQDITKDRNCLFWTFLFIDTFVYFLLNGYNYSPEHVVKLLLEKYNTKEKLLKLIDQFKYYILESNI